MGKRDLRNSSSDISFPTSSSCTVALSTSITLPVRPKPPLHPLLEIPPSKRPRHDNSPAVPRPLNVWADSPQKSPFHCQRKRRREAPPPLTISPIPLQSRWVQTVSFAVWKFILPWLLPTSTADVPSEFDEAPSKSEITLINIAEALFPLVALVGTRLIKLHDGQRDKAFLATAFCGSVRVGCWLACPGYKQSLSMHPLATLDVQRAIRIACTQGHTEFVVWICKPGLPDFPQLNQEQVIASGAFEGCCEVGNMELARWLSNSFLLSSGISAYSCGTRGLQEACKQGRLGFAEWIVRDFNLLARDARADGNRAFLLACAYGHLPVAKWLASRFHLRTEDARDRDYRVWFAVCTSGHLHIAKYIAERFYFDATDLQHLERNAAFDVCCRNGHWEMATWIADKFCLTGSEIRGSDGSIQSFVYCCESGALQFAQWLVDRFELTLEDCKHKDMLSLRRSCKNGHLNVVKWLYQHFELTAYYIRAKNLQVLRTSCKHGHLSVAQWLTKTFGLTAVDVTESKAIQSCYSHGQTEVLAWLFSIFPRETDSN